MALRLRFRNRIFLALGGVVCAALAAALVVVRQETERRARAEIEERFERTRVAFRQLQALRRRGVADEVESLARANPLFRTVLSTASMAGGDLGFGGLPSAEDALRDANLRLRSLLPSLAIAQRNEVFVVASADAALLFGRAEPERFGDDLSGVSLLREAAGGGQAAGLWSRPAELPAGLRLVPELPPGAVYEVIAQPIAFGEEVHGLVLVGNRVDHAALEAIRTVSQVHLGLRAEGGPLVSTLPPERAAALAAHLEAGRAAGAAPALWSLGGERYLVAAAELVAGAAGPPLLLLRSLDEELAFVRALELALAGVGTGVLAAALGVAFALARRITRPVAELVQAAERVGRGDLDAGVAIDTGDELEDLGRTFNSMVSGLRERDRIRRTFERHVSKHVAEELLRHPDSAGSAGVRREVTVLFADLGGFTGLAEQSQPEAVVARLNEYFGVVCEAVLEEDGTVNELLGDGVLAFFNAPIEQADHAVRGCRAAMRIRERLAALVARWRREGLPAPGFRIGLHTGWVVAGEMGTAERGKYGIIGDAVNLASRIEGANKFYGTSLLASLATRARAGAAVAFREIDTLRVAGRAAPVRVFEPLALGGLEGAARDAVARYEAALAAHRAGEWATADALLAALVEARPDDGPSRTLLARVRALEAKPPARWDGVFEPDAK
jgi:class 3 adenylate cyclase